MTPEQLRALLSPETEIYRSYVETAENNVQRRLETNRYYFTLVAAIFVAYGYLAEGKLALAAAGQSNVSSQLSQFGVLFGLPALLIIVCLAWLMQLVSFRKLSKAKYGVIHMLETQLPERPFTNEWAAVQRDTVVRGSTVETVVPSLFLLVGWLALLMPVLMNDPTFAAMILGK